MIYKDGELLCTTHRGAGPLACGYTAESAVQYEGLRRLLKIIPANNPTPCRVSIFTDSLSLLTALETGPLTVTGPILRLLWNLILQVQRRKARIQLQFIFGHCGVVKNEKSDTEAKKDAELPQRTDTWITDIIAYAKRMLKVKEEDEPPPSHRLKITGSWDPTKDNPELTREEETALARFRTGASHRYGWLLQKIQTHMPPGCRWFNHQQINMPAPVIPPS
ncbi:Tbingi protein [Trypanosoma theileri]|uniref:Tbingi protein n=1 Tax=Trypanosoma theileri TaxID=67003 RepID=A0A1X0P2Y1_9TRYP|nr:Tbingi protein [Trypanosoma theileri]ORC91294.1 Tbingi protein [Trypanosoma theileri]